MAAVTDNDVDNGIRDKRENVLGGQTELESGQYGSELADIERVERVYRCVIAYRPQSDKAEWSIKAYG